MRKKLHSRISTKWLAEFMGLIFLSSLLIGATLTVPVTAAFTISAGNTLHYKVTEFRAPLNDITDTNIFTSVDLTGSDIYVKILRTDTAAGWYTVGLAGILGQDMTFNLTSVFNTTSAFGLNFENTVVKGGSGAALDLPEIKMWSFFDFNNNKAGLFYLDEDKWTDHKTALENAFGSNVTIDNGASEFTATFGNATDSLKLVWAKSGENAGILKSFRLDADVELSGGSSGHIVFEMTLQSRQTRELPNKSRVTMNLNRGDLSYSVTGNFTNMTNDLENAKQNISAWVGHNVLRYDIQNRDGVFYQVEIFAATDPSNPNAGLASVGTSYYNGFSGSQAGYDSLDDLYWPVSLLPIPIALDSAPLLTPDWEVHRGQFLLVNDILTTLETIIHSNDFKTQVLDGMGITINDFAIELEFQEASGFKHIVVTFSVALNIDGQRFYANQSSFYEGQGTLDFSTSGRIWSTYSDDGVLAASGQEIQLNIKANSFGYVYNTGYYNVTSITDGDLSLNLNTFVKNPDFSTVPEPTTAAATSPTAPPAITPSFEFVPVFLLLSVLGVASVRIKRNNRFKPEH